MENREALIEAVGATVGLGTWFTSVLEESESTAAGGYEGGSCPVAEHAAKHLINLPTHQGVEIGDVDAIVSAIVQAGARTPRNQAA